MKVGALIFILWQSVSKAKRRRISAVPEKGKGGRDSARCARAIPVGESVLERREGASAPCRKKEEEGGIPLATLALSRWGGGDLSEAKAHQRRAEKKEREGGIPLAALALSR